LVVVSSGWTRIVEHTFEVTVSGVGVQQLAQARAAIAALTELPLTGQQPQDLLDLSAALFTMADRLDAVIQRAVEQIIWDRASMDGAHLGPIRWMIEHCRRPAGEASTRVKVAERIIDHPASAAAHQAGNLNLTHLKIITGTLQRLPETDRDTAEEILLRAAEHLDPKTLARLARELEATIDPDGEDERAARRFRSRYLNVVTTFAGMVHLDGLLDPETGAALLAALTPLTTPAGDDDERSAGQRRADALGHLARHALAAGDLPEVNGAKPLLQITIDWQTLLDGVGVGRIGPTGLDLPLDIGAIRRLACDANILPAVLGGPSQILDIGRKSATWTLAIRQAAALRDQGCTFPGCHAPLAFCELHHIRHWIRDLGPSSLTNSTHLCVRHHHLVHDKNWTLLRHPDNTLTFTDPTGKTTTSWQPPTTLSDYLPATAPPLAPVVPLPLHTGPDVACQPPRQITTLQIRPSYRGDDTEPASWPSPVWVGTAGRPSDKRAPARTGNRNVSVVPAPCRLATSIDPPARRARSRSRPRPTCRPPRPPPTLAASKPGPSSRTVAST
jgi:hypothetical protein